MKKVIAAGHICLDITPVFEQGREYPAIDKMFVPGGMTDVGAADIHTGGSVSNTGLAMKKLGADVKLLGKVGDDAFGRMVEDIAAQWGAGGLIRDPACSTSYTVVMAIPGKDRFFIHNAGANALFSAEDIPDSALRGAELFHFGYPTLMKKIYENNGAGLAGLFRRAKSLGLKTSLDLSMPAADSEAARLDWRAILKGTLPFVDYFVPSYEETAFLMGYPVQSMESPDIMRDVRPLAAELREMGAGIVLIKCGASGLYCLSGEEEIIQPAYKPEIICSTTGAGDTCIAAFLMSVLEGRSLADCARLAAAEGACCVTAYDALGGLLTLEELERKIEAGWETV